MTRKSDILFVQSGICGSLYYHNVYSFYGEPLIFSAMNEYGQLYFCYSLGCNDSHDRWIIVPTSQGRINKLEQKDISIFKMIQPTLLTKVLRLDIDLENSSINESFEVASKLPYKMPGEDVFIRENINWDNSRKHTHRIRIAKKSNNSIISETLNRVSEVFGEFCRGYLSKFDIPVSFYPQDAVTGSFVYRVKTETNKDSDFKTKGYEVLSKISSQEDFLTSLDEREVDLRVVRQLFDLIGTNDIEIQLIDENTTKTLLELGPEYVASILPDIDDKLGSYLDSSMVPQADNLSRIKKYLSIVDNNRVVSSEELGVEPRQVKYYKDACKLLSLIHEYSILTPLGLKVATSEIENEWVNIIRKQFEDSDCGNLWMINQGVDSIIEIPEDSATDFLINHCNGLSESTSKRRAQTLKSWVRKFKELS